MPHTMEDSKYNSCTMAKTLLQTFRKNLECEEIDIHPLFSALIALSGSLFICLHGVEGNRVGH